MAALVRQHRQSYIGGMLALEQFKIASMFEIVHVAYNIVKIAYQTS